LSDIPPPDALTAALAGRYEFQRELGRGGMATVYLAADRKHHRQVAIKVLRPDLAATLGAERFLKEIEIAARLTHPHILALHDSGEAGGYLYYVMPYIEGGSLRQVLEKERRLEVERAFGIAGFVADALGYAHRMGVLHRDIKPENILFSQGHPVVADFGIAKAISTAGGANLTRTGFPLGTPGYMSPEQAAGLTDLDERTDVYSLGVVVYEMLVGETPGRWPSEESVRTGRLLEASPSHRLQLARLPDRVEGALARAFAIRGEQRTASPGALIADLRGEAGAAIATPASPPSGGGASSATARGPGAGGDPAGVVAGPTATDASHRRYNENEVQELVRRAAELDASHATTGGAMTIGGVQRLAEEALIPPERVREAARAMEARRAEPVTALADGTPDTAGQRAARFWLGAPTYLLFERVVTGEVPDVEFAALVEVMRAEMGQLGQGGQLGRSFSWATVRSGAGGRDVQVLVSVRGGTTRIQVRENLGQLAGGIMGGVGGGLGGGGLGPIFGGLAGGMHSPLAALVALPFWLGTVYAGARSIYYYSVKRRRAQLARLTDQLADLAAQVVPLRLR
jgi:predicted Ser/Thr protein kinase